jgi:hypothetical protein
MTTEMAIAYNIKIYQLTSKINQTFRGLNRGRMLKAGDVIIARVQFVDNEESKIRKNLK